MNDDFLTKIMKPPRREFVAALYERISNPMHTQPKYQKFRAAALILAALMILAVGLLALPPVRAFAEGILRQVGGYAFQQGQPYNGAHEPSAIQIDKTYDSVSIVTNGKVPTAHDAAGASQLAGFQVLSPAYLPTGYTDMGAWYVATESNGRVATRGYHDPTNHFLILNQLKHPEHQPPQVFAREQIVDVTVRGHPGVWLPSPANIEGKNALVWEENGITYSLLTDSLPLDELLKVAASLGQ